MSKIRFGTDGWRAIIADSFTFENVRIIAQATAEYLISQGTAHQGIAVGYDYRFQSETYAQLTAEVLAANGIKVFLGREAEPTPALSYAVKDCKCAGGIMITASHNPPQYNGVKFKGYYGGSAVPSITKEIEKFLYQNTPKTISAQTKCNIEEVDQVTPYLNKLKSLVDMNLISKAKFTVAHDAMHGSGKNYLEKLLEGTGSKVISINSNRDCLFGGVLPEPIGKNLKALIEAVKTNNAALGVGTDGDADRFGAIDNEGNFIWPHYTIPLLYEHLRKNRGWTGDVVHTVSLAPIIDRMVADYGDSKVTEVAVGFKNVCELMLTQDILIGGEESGGIGIKNHIPERDGLAMAMLALEMLAMSGKTLKQMSDDLVSRYGAFHYDRIDAHMEDSVRLGLVQKLKDNPPTSIAGKKVVKVTTLDGIKFSFEGNGWILIRTSDTEPVIRLYSGSESMDTTWEILNDASKIVGLK